MRPAFLPLVGEMPAGREGLHNRLPSALQVSARFQHLFGLVERHCQRLAGDVEGEAGAGEGGKFLRLALVIEFGVSMSFS